LRKTYNLDLFLSKFQKVPITELPFSQNGSEPIVTVFVYAYNHEKYIDKCLQSILNQRTEYPFVIYLGEDNSSDDTRKICRQYALKYPDKIKCVLHARENNISILEKPSGRFNAMYGFLSSESKYFAICEGDDYWIDPLKLQKQINFLESNDQYNFSCGKIKLLNNLTGELIERKEPRMTRNRPYLTAKDYIIKNVSQTSSFLFRSDFDFPLWYSEIYTGDKALVLLSTKEEKIKIHNEYFSVYRQHTRGLSNIIKKNLKRTYDGELHLWKNLLKLDHVFSHKKLVDFRIKEAYYLYKQNDTSFIGSKIFYFLMKKYSSLIRNFF